MYKQPLFGEDSSPHITSMFISSIVTLVCWIIFCVLCFVIKFKPKTPEYKEVQIVLSSTPVVAPAVPEPVEGQSESAPAAAMQEEAAVVEPVETTPVPEPPKPVETPVAEAKVDAPKETPKPAKAQTQPAKTQTQPAKEATKAETPADKKVNYEIVKSVDELMNEQMNAEKKQSQIPDWFYEDTTSASEPFVSKPVTKVDNAASFSGTAGSATKNQNQGAVSSSNSTNNDNNPSPEESTLDKLKGIKGATPKTSSKNGINTDFTLEDDANTIQMSNGKRRRVIVSSPIDLSPEAASKIDFKTYTFVITFKVLPSGYILASDVTIKDEFILDQIIIDEIKSQISKWRLEEADYTATATFNFTIKKQ